MVFVYVHSMPPVLASLRAVMESETWVIYLLQHCDTYWSY